MNPKSFLVSPPQEYVALHQHGKLGGRSGVPRILGACGMMNHSNSSYPALHSACARYSVM